MMASDQHPSERQRSGGRELLSPGWAVVEPSGHGQGALRREGNPHGLEPQLTQGTAWFGESPCYWG